MSSAKNASKLEFLESLSELRRKLEPEKTFLIYDLRLAAAVPQFRDFLSSFQFHYGVHSGEELKELRNFPVHCEKMMKRMEPLSPKELSIAALGGGSVGDFAGFFASVYKRGVRLLHVPSTWLAAIDSSHGGKTALNAGGAKNQIGTFHPAARVILARSLLLGQPDERVQDGMGELGKIALIDNGAWVRDLERAQVEGATLLWKFLRPAIEAKLKVVRRDPKEATGQRQVLNLGHTMGHVFETGFGWSHGHAVAQGLFFALELSRKLGHLPEKQLERAHRLLSEKLGLRPDLPARPLPFSTAEKLLAKDKKRAGASKVTFISLRRLGRPERVSLSLDHLLREAQAQGWIARPK